MAVTITVTLPAQLLRIITIAASLLIAFSAGDDSYRRPLIPVNYGAFTQTASYSIANQLGYFTDAGLNVTYLQVPNSTYGYAQLLSGGYDVLTGTIDNAVNLRFNAHKNLTVLGQLDGGPDLVIASAQAIQSVADLKGKSIIVDSPVSGYAYILRKVLSAFGLELQNGDYTFQVLLSFPLPSLSLTTSPDRRIHQHTLCRPHQRLHRSRRPRRRHHPDLPFHRLCQLQRDPNPRPRLGLHPAALLLRHHRGRAVVEQPHRARYHRPLRRRPLRRQPPPRQSQERRVRDPRHRQAVERVPVPGSGRIHRRDELAHG